MRRAFRSLLLALEPPARRLAEFQARLLLDLFYWVVIGPSSLLVRFGPDPLSRKPGSGSWTPRPEDAEGPRARAARQS
jgi:hypothetical protein